MSKPVEAQKRLLRGLLRRVHPDLFTAYPDKQLVNSESLKTVNNYVDSLGRGGQRPSSEVTFWVKEGDDLVSISALLPQQASLGPLFLAFDLITREELKMGFGSLGTSQADVDLLAWLSETVAAAVETGQERDARASHLRVRKLILESKYGLGPIQLGSEYAAGLAELQHQVESLGVLETWLASCGEASKRLKGLSLRLHHPYSPARDAGMMGRGPDLDGDCYISDDGVLHILADADSIDAQITGLNLSRARTLDRLTSYWLTRVTALSPRLKDVLHVENVWCDVRTEASQQKFVVWAGTMLEHQQRFNQVLGERSFSFSVIVHSDPEDLPVAFLSDCSVLSVRSDCRPLVLLDFLCSEMGSLASEAATTAEDGRAREKQLLEEVQEALGLKAIIRVVPVSDCDKVEAACLKLLANADRLKAMIDLRGSNIAIDDRYDVWDSGFVSIPYDFDVSDLQPQLQRLLGPSQDEPGAPSSSRGDDYYAEVRDREGDAQYNTNAVRGRGRVSSPASVGIRIAVGTRRPRGPLRGMPRPMTRHPSHQGNALVR